MFQYFGGISRFGDGESSTYKATFYVILHLASFLALILSQINSFGSRKFILNTCLICIQYTFGFIS